MRARWIRAGAVVGAGAAGLVMALGPSLPGRAAASAGASGSPDPLTLHLSSTPAVGLPTPTAADGVGPGDMIVIEQGSTTLGCTANFVWTDSSGNRYLGTAGHCLLPSTVAEAGAGQLAGIDQHILLCVKSCLFGGQTGFLLNSTVDLGAAGFYARQYPNGESGVLGDDFALIKLPAGMAVRTAVPVWGGPTGPGTVGTGSPVCMYGNAEGLGELFVTKARAGVGVGQQADPAPDQGLTPWYADIPSFEGDSGSAVVNCTAGADGLTGTTAVGILTDLVAGGAGVVEGTTVAQAEKMTAADTGLTISLVAG